jgi:hypothetical protein
MLGIKIHKLCDLTGYTYDMSTYLGKDGQNATQATTATHVTEKSLTRTADEVAHKLYMDNFFSSLDIYNEAHTTYDEEQTGNITAVELSERIINECLGTLVLRH